MHGDAKPFPGHPKNPFSDDDLDGKLRENVEPVAGLSQTAKLAVMLRAMEKVGSVRELTALMAFDSDIDGAPEID